MMIVSMIPAMAANDYKLTIENTVKDHTYTAYQIFKGSKADKSQAGYTVLANDATFNATTAYYEKNGADYEYVTVTEDNFADKKANLYVRTGDSALGDVIWGDDITDAGKKALY